MRSRLRPGEDLAMEVRRHWIALAAPLGVALFLAGCLAAAAFVDRPYVLPAAAVAFAVAGVWALGRWLVWRADLWVVTSERVIDESGVLTVRVIDSPLERIHNVSCVRTLWGRVLGYGTLNIQTAAESGSATIPDVAGPEELREAILAQQQRARRGGGAGADPAAPDGTAAGDVRDCPWCAETIKVKARICRYCGRTV